ncbi:MAG: cyclodeaminase/cyclohydrolase family protein [Peptoniphilaceae bacterium]|nr:cyclodeaminase/cyclohydrolase family protein [Peptoniphilaceae bacterium]MDY6018898.1 cyclodeaminase/cyclohydrolase family protein [Anaerococcus sp.]
MMIDFTVDKLLEQTRKKNANPGGGALVSLIGNLAINLLLMVDRKSYPTINLEIKAQYRKKRLLEISKRLEEVMQEDIDKINILLKAYKNEADQKEIEIKTLSAIKPPRQTIDLVLEAMDISDFFLENGRIEAISDGQIANRLMKEAVMSSIINIEINQKHVTYDFDKEYIINRCNKLYDRNVEIIKGRNK